MSTAASNAAPVVVRSQSSGRTPPSSYAPNPQTQLSRARSTNQRPTAPAQQRSNSRSYSQDGSASNPTALANMARNDWEDTNLARSSSSRRTSREKEKESTRDDQPPEHDPESKKNERSSSKPNSRRNSRDMSTQAKPATNGTTPQPPPAPVQPSPVVTPGYPPQGRRRTSITTQTGTWSLGKTIGQGSMGKVKLAKNIETGESTAIKIIPRQSTDEHGNPKDERSDRSKEIRTAREAAMVTLLDHPFICGMRDVQRTNYHWYMLFEYVNGGQMLDYIIAHGRLKEKQARKFGRQIASALDYCHRNSIVHRDLKIENILISKSGDIKIIDFGLSNLYSPRSLLKTFCGSLYFAAPELLNARQYTGPEVDVWSFGIVLYVLVCGKVPFDDQSMPQLHAKIKRGIVDYPQWLTAECRSIISRMLVVDPKERASLQEIMNHPWMTKGFNAPPENYLPPRMPLQLPLDPAVVEKMQGFDFGSASFINEQLTRVLESDEYQTAVRRLARDNDSQTPGSDRKRGVFDFYKRRNSMSRETLPSSSTELSRGTDPLNAYSPLISVYHLAKEKIDRERVEQNPGGLAIPHGPNEPVLKMPGLPSPEAAHTNNLTPEISGDRTSSGRSRPRARTNGEDEVAQDMQQLDIGGPRASHVSHVSNATQTTQDTPIKKEGAAMGLLRRFSTRRNKDRDADRAPPPSLNVLPPQDSTTTPRKSFSVRRRRQDQEQTTLPSAGSQPQHEGLLSANAAAKQGNKLLGRSTSVNSADYRPRRFLGRGAYENAEAQQPAPNTSGSDRSSTSAQKESKVAEATDGTSENLSPAPPARVATAGRTKSLGHARQESIQARRQKREEAKKDIHGNVPEETDAELRADGYSDTPATPSTPRNQISKPGGLKGLFSSSTTSSKSPEFIRHDIIRVLKQLGVESTEIRGGFSCRHAPSINLEDVRDYGGPMEEEKSGRVGAAPNRRISFGGFRNKDREDEKGDKPQRQSSRRRQPDQSFVSNSEGSEEYIQHMSRGGEQGRDMAATTTRVQDDTGERLVLRFEIAIVKIPLFSLHGIQFKKVQGVVERTWTETASLTSPRRQKGSRNDDAGQITNNDIKGPAGATTDCVIHGLGCEIGSRMGDGKRKGSDIYDTILAPSVTAVQQEMSDTQGVG